MKLIFKLSSLAVLALSALFYWFFMFTKHDPSLSSLIPFGDDPYDAIGSFCMILSIPLTILVLVRAFRPYSAPGPSLPQMAFLARAQAAVALGVLVAIAADCVAMIRHPSQWTGKASTGELLALIFGVAALSAVVLFQVRHPARRIDLTCTAGPWRRALIVLLASIAILALFPEEIIRNALAHFLTIVLSFVLIAAPQTALAVALLPFDTAQVPKNPESARARFRLWTQWGGVTLFGLMIGASAGTMELFGEGGERPPMMQILLVGSLFTGAGTAALLIAFAFFRKPLGLFYRASQT